MIVFLHVHKTAGSTFQFILENSLGIAACHTNHAKKPVFGQADLEFARKVFPGLRSIAGHNLIDPLSLSVPDPCYMTFLREPVARVFSRYQGSVVNAQNKMSFEESLRKNDDLENWHVRMMAGGRDLDKAKRFLEKCRFVGLTEKFDLSLHVLERLSPVKLNLNYNRRRVISDNSIKQALERDSRAIEMAREYNKLDLELYAFGVNEIFPKLCAQAGFKPTDKVASYDKYASEVKWKYVLSHFYNMVFYRQLCKARNKYFSRPAPASVAAGKQ